MQGVGSKAVACMPIDSGHDWLNQILILGSYYVLQELFLYINFKLKKN